MTRVLIAIGAPVNDLLRYVGALCLLVCRTLRWVAVSLVLRRVRFGRFAFYTQLVRVGLRSVGVVSLVSGCIGLILALQMGPPLAQFNQTSQVATIIAIAVVRELGPLISAIVLTGFAGASIAAELGTMVVGEEIEALEAHALNPVRFLVVPRLVATTLAMVGLALVSMHLAIGAGMLVGVGFLGIPARVYWDNTLSALDLPDLWTGLYKAAVFGLIMGGIACHHGLGVTGGAAGVGRATTRTVVDSVIFIILTDLLFTAMFYKLGWT